MKYLVKTAHGISNEFYQVGALRLSPVWNGTRKWCISFSMALTGVVMLTTLTILAPLSKSFADPWGDILEERNADSFVDDTSNECNDAHLEMAMAFEELIAHAQACAQIWERILYSSGSALELKKCFWYMVYRLVGEWLSSDGTDYILSWNYCTHLGKSS
jgi:hypothetical protein